MSDRKQVTVSRCFDLHQPQTIGWLLERISVIRRDAMVFVSDPDLCIIWKRDETDFEVENRVKKESEQAADNDKAEAQSRLERMEEMFDLALEFGYELRKSP